MNTAKCPACSKPSLDGHITCGLAICDEAGWRETGGRHDPETGDFEIPTLDLDPTALPIASEPMLENFLTACIRSGMRELTCERCGQPWLSRNSSALCPVCDPAHPGYQPGGNSPEQCARWERFWRENLLECMMRRST